MRIPCGGAPRRAAPRTFGMVDAGACPSESRKRRHCTRRLRLDSLLSSGALPRPCARARDRSLLALGRFPSPSQSAATLDNSLCTLPVGQRQTCDGRARRTRECLAEPRRTWCTPFLARATWRTPQTSGEPQTFCGALWRRCVRIRGTPIGHHAGTAYLARTPSSASRRDTPSIPQLTLCTSELASP